MSYRGLHEILTNRYWDIEPSALHAFRDVISRNLSGHVQLEMEGEGNQHSFVTNLKSGFTERVYSGNAYWCDSEDLEPDDKFIHVVNICGPVTRNGGACSYGSRDHRDFIMYAADQDWCTGILFYIDTPGGSAFSRNDYLQAVEYARSKGKPVVAFIDGLCCSAGMAVACMCDEIYYAHENDEVGCIGTMMACWTNKPGDTNAITGETYAELYATGSPYKNIEYRELAAGDSQRYQKELDGLAEEFKQMVRDLRPSVKEEQLLGLTYRAGEVEGELVDAKNTFAGCCERILALADGSAEPLKQSEPVEGPEEDPVENPEEEPVQDPDRPSNPDDEPAADTAAVPQETTINHKSEKEMKEYSLIQSALGLQSLASDADNALYLNEELCDTMESAIAEYQKKESALKAKMADIASLNAAIEKMQTDHQAEIENLKAEHEKALQEAADSALTEKQAAENIHASELEGINASHAEALKGLEDRIAELEAQVSAQAEQLQSKEDELQELSQETTAPDRPAQAPKDNGLGVNDEPARESVQCVCKDSMTPAEKRKAVEDRMRELRLMRSK